MYVSALVLISFAALILAMNKEEAVFEGKVVEEVGTEDELGAGVEVLDEVEVGVKLLDDDCFAEDLVGNGIGGAKHLVAKVPLVKQKVLEGSLSFS